MTAVQAIIVLIIRIWAVNAIIAATFSLAQTVGMMFSGAPTYQGGFAYELIATVTATLVFWAIVLRYSGAVTSRILVPGKDSDQRILIDGTYIIRTGTFLIGAYALTQNMPWLIRDVPDWIGVFADTATTSPRGSIFPFPLAGQVLAVLIALWLIFRPGHAARLFSQMGRPQQPEAQAAPGEEGKAE